MKTLKITCLLVLFSSIISFGQDITVDEIFANSLENTGGVEAWEALEGMKLSAKINQGGMEMPVTIVYLADGRQYISFEFQGMTFKQEVFDGTDLWSTNFQSMKAEKADAESTSNKLLDLNDWPAAYHNYKEKGYTAELLGTEEVDGAETYKVKLVTEPIMVDGVETESVTYYYFDSEAFVVVMEEEEMKSGPMAGNVMQMKQSEFQEVDGLYFAHSMSQGVKGGQSQPIMIEKIEVNPVVDEAEFNFPAEAEGTEEDAEKETEDGEEAPKDDLKPVDEKLEMIKNETPETGGKKDPKKMPKKDN